MSYSIRYHGNYCGPGWSDGKRQASVVGITPPTDVFDATCKQHDAAYATSKSAQSLTQADLDFAYSNILTTNPKRIVAGVLVGAQGLLRGFDSNIETNQTNTTMLKRNLRGTSAAKRVKLATKQAKSNMVGTALTTVPAAYGFSLKMTPPKIRRNGDTAHIIGSDFAGTCFVVNTANYQPAATIFLNPAYFQNAMLGSMARAYEKFRFIKASIHYIPSVPTSTQGQLVMCSTRTVKEPFFNGASTTFLSRALSQGNALATPLWKEAVLEVPCSSEWSIVDALLDGDLDDCIQEEIQCYSTCDTTGSAGIFMLHYEVEFKDPLYTYHPTLIPVPVGNGSTCTLTDNSAVNAVGDNIALNNPTGFTYGDPGSVYRLVFRQEASTRPTGPASWAAVANVVASGASTSSTVVQATSNIGLNTGSVFYGVVVGTNMHLYADYESATIGSTSGYLSYQTATTAAGTWYFHIHLVRLSNVLRTTNQ